MERKEKLEPSYVGCLKNLLQRIYETGIAFFKQTIKYLERSNILNSSLGLFLTSLSKSSINTVLNEFININHYSSFIDQRDGLLRIFKENSSEENFKIFLGIIYSKWKGYFDRLLTNQDFYLFDILLTDYANYVAAYYIKEPTDKIKDLLQEILHNIINLDSIWFKDESRMKTNVLLNISHLYLLSFGYKENSIKSNVIEQLYTKIKNDKILDQRFLSEQKLDLYLKKMDENIMWDSF